MRVPTVADQLRIAAVGALRGVFAGIGQLLLATDQLRAEEATSSAGDSDRNGGQDPLSAWARARATNTAQARATDTAQAPAPPPIPGYDDLSLASFRARLRGLTTSQLAQLADYEKAHANREEVVTLFERRIAKLKSGGA